MVMAELPSGTVTFLFTDIEGSTRLLARLRERYADLLADQQRLLRAVFAEHDGSEIDTQGDSFFVAFPRAREAVAAAVAGQRALVRHEWPGGAEVKVRMGVHTGEPSVGGARYVGLGVHRAARIAAAAHGGQVLLSSVTRGLVEDELPPGVELRDLGEHRLKDLDRPERLSQLAIAGLPADFPPPRTAGLVPLDLSGREQALGEAAVEAVSGGLGRRFWIAGAAAVLAVAGGVATLLAATLGGGAYLHKVPLNSLAMIDPTSNRIVVDVPVGANASGLVVADGSVWVINEDDRTLMRIDIHSRKLVKTIALDGAPTGIASGDGSIWILNAASPDSSQAEITRVSPSFDDIAERIPTDLGYGDVVEGDLAVGGGSIWIPTPIGDLPYQVVERIDERTHRVLARIRIFGIRVAQAGATFGEGAFWVVDARGLVRVDPADNSTSVLGMLGGGGVAVGAGAAWVGARFPQASTTREGTPGRPGYVSKIDLADTATRALVTAPDPVAISVGAGAVWVANRQTHTVERIDPKTNTHVATIRIGNTPTALTTSADEVWVVVS